MKILLMAAGAASLLATGAAVAEPGKAKAGKPAVMGQKYGGDACPPGLGKKSPACVPPGQATRMFREGQRVPVRYRYFTPYADIPEALRDQYDLDDDYRYIYRDNVIYVVDPETNLISRIIDAVL